MADTLALRAARYFGWSNKPRTSLHVGKGRVLVVGRHGDRTLLMLYAELEGRAWGTHVNLTERQRAGLVAGLSEAGS